MNTLGFVGRGLRHHARAHAATLGGAALGCAVLVGALSVGDSVRASLERAARERLGVIDGVLGDGQRFFDGARLARALGQGQEGARFVPVIQLDGVAATPDGARRVDAVQVLGVEPEFFELGPGRAPARLEAGRALLGQELARRLGAAVGDELVLRVPRPSAMSRELALVSVEDALQPLRVSVAGVLEDADFGAFSLNAGAGPAANLFVAREWLASELDVPGRANRVLVDAPSPQTLAANLRSAWELADVGLAFERPGDAWELTSDQVFLPEALPAGLGAYRGPLLGVFTYFVNELRHGERATPYSMVGALGAVERELPDLGGWQAAVPPGLAADELVINSWLAEDLAAGVGDEIALRYFVLGPGRELLEEQHSFRVRAVIETRGTGADPSLMPAFPGLADEENCRDWDPGLPLDLEAIRDRDEEYWDLHRGAPKAFVSLPAAREMWGNRFGSLTALRVPDEKAEEFLGVLRSDLDPSALGLSFAPLSGVVEATSDFGALFLGLSCFLIASALVLTALFFAFSIEKRAAELGVLRVSGFTARGVAAIYVGEAALIFALGVVLGSALGLGYTGLLLQGLEFLWRDAVGRTTLVFHVEPRSLCLGAGLSLALSLGTVGAVLRRSLAQPPLRLLQGSAAAALVQEPRRRAPGRRLLVAVAWLAAFGCLAGARAAHGQDAAALAFGAGACALVGGILLVRARLTRRSRVDSLLSLGWSSASRRRGRSLATVSLMASAVLLLVVAGANRQGPAAREAPRDSGTGGFAFLGRTSLPVLHDLEEAAGREYYGLAPAEMDGVSWLALRVRAGDEASCLNLDRPKNPRLLGVEGGRLSGRFRFADAVQEVADPWSLLDAELGPLVVPVIVDATSLEWTLHGRLGDELELLDGRGQAFRARVVATLEDSILQGDLLLSQASFERLFPGEAGWRAFLVDVAASRAREVAARLTRALSDEGLVLVPANERLDLLHGVQNTYLAIFQLLGGLGFVLGSIGLFALVQRNAIERRAELALLRALGFTRARLRWLLLGENGALVAAGLALGAVAGAFVLLAQGGRAEAGALASLFLWIALFGLSGCAWIALGTGPALRGAPFETLQNE